MERPEQMRLEDERALTGSARLVVAHEIRENGTETLPGLSEIGFQRQRLVVSTQGLLTSVEQVEYSGATLPGLGKIRLLSNSTRKVVGLDGYGLEIVEQVPV